MGDVGIVAAGLSKDVATALVLELRVSEFPLIVGLLGLGLLKDLLVFLLDLEKVHNEFTININKNYSINFESTMHGYNSISHVGVLGLVESHFFHHLPELFLAQESLNTLN